MRASPLPSALTMVEAGCQSTAGARRLTPNTKSSGGNPSLTCSPSLRHGVGQGGSPARGPAQGSTPWAVSQQQPSADRDSLGSPRTCSGSSEARVAGAQTHSTEMRPNSPRGCCTLPWLRYREQFAITLKTPFRERHLWMLSVASVPRPENCRSRGGSASNQLLRHCCSAAISLRTTAQPCPTTREQTKQSQASPASEKARG